MTAQATAPALDVEAARAATDRLRLTLTDAHEQLIDLWHRSAHEALGYGRGTAGWAAYCAAEFGELLNVRLPAAQRGDVLAAMVDAGMSQRQAAAPFAISLGSVNAALKARRAAAAPVVEAPQPAVFPRFREAAQLVATAGAAGLTIPQLQRRTRWTYGAASGALCRAEAAGLVHRPADVERRAGFRPYVALPMDQA